MSQTVVALPRLIELRSHYYPKLLQCVKGEGEAKEDFVQFSGDHVGSADAKFEVHRSKTGYGVVHIRSCYNSKYLVLDKYKDLIAAKAEKPEEDQSKRSCTLLRPTYVDGDPKKIRLTHVHLEKNLHFSLELSYFEPGILLALATQSNLEDSPSTDVFDVIDWPVLLPKYVAFKGDNDKFLRAHWPGNRNCLQFWDPNMEDYPNSVGNEIVQTPNGNVSIRNLHYDRYWRLVPNWIWADSTTSGSDDTLFEPIRISHDTIALRNVANKLFCTRDDKEDDCLTAGSSVINTRAKFKVSELIISREIENINFRLMDARIYDEHIVTMVSRPHTNGTSTTNEETLELSYTDTYSRTWNCNVSLKASIETTFKGGIPVIAAGGIKLDFGLAAGYTWGETKEGETRITSSVWVPVPPNTKVTARVMATRGTCDVPFSYTQRDLLHSGETVVTEMDDGVYTGVNNYNFYTETKEDPLINDPKIPAAIFKKVATVSPSGEMTPI